MTNTFEALGLPSSILAAISKVGFTTPTPIQAAAIPLAMQGRDILGSAQTGTGKTAAFGIPMIAKLIEKPQSVGIVMTPTRELAAQVLSTLKPLLAGQQNIRTALLIGGESMHKQLQQLKTRPRIIVGTPGRINDHLDRRSLNLSNADILVLDEMDRMLDMGFGVQIDCVLTYMPKQRQTLLFSATVPAEIERVAQRYQNNPERVSVGSLVTPVAAIKQELLHIREGEKYDQLIQQLYDRKGSVIVFVKTKFGAKRMAEKLTKMDFKADAIHGNLNQNKRDRVIRAFREKQYRVLVATDVAARGLDIPHIEHVINYDLPQCPEDYIHRIGRTARNGAEGNAVAFITPSEGRLWHAIHKLMNPDDRTPAPRTNDRPQNKRSRNGSGKKIGARKFEDRKFPDRKEKAEGGKYDPLNAGGKNHARPKTSRFKRKFRREEFSGRDGGQARNRAY
ncbi:MAG: DEAD/DEAH box helicase [Alphaproteobacteria bacterium]|nr:DEAD/DEAH box helicase [Alphaproteobacteria bacterium]